MHNATLRAKGRPERYVSFTVPASDAALRLVVTVAPRVGLVGASVTSPHKTAAARMATCDAVAKAVGAANQLKFHPDGKVEATNTDATALRDLLRPHVGKGTTAVVLGAGGAARAALWALHGLGAAATVTSRDPKRAELAKPLAAAWVPWERRDGLRADVWIQATTLGLRAGDPNPAEPHGARLAFELNYKGGPTAFQAAATAAGAAVLDGKALVLEQAVHAQRFWFGAEPDRKAMEAAVAG
jgi:shikimate dehydrogenase